MEKYLSEVNIFNVWNIPLHSLSAYMSLEHIKIAVIMSTYFFSSIFSLFKFLDPRTFG